MIVVLTGAHSCGKSTLVEFFRGKEGFECVDSVTRSTISKEDRKVDGVQNLDKAQYAILDNIEKATLDLVKKNAEHPEKIYLLDRCVFDFIAYTRCFAKKGLVSQECLEDIENTCRDYWKYYDLVGYLGIEFPIVADGVRSEDEELRKQVDQEIRGQIFWNQVKAVELNGSVRQRVESLQKYINLVIVARQRNL